MSRRSAYLFISFAVAFGSVAGCAEEEATVSQEQIDQAEDAITASTKPKSFREFKTKSGESQGIFGGSRMRDKENINYLKEQGIKTVLSFQSLNEEIVYDRQFSLSATLHWDSPEEHRLKRAGIKFIRKSWFAGESKSFDYAKEVMEIMKDESLRPIYVHCEYGMDRTGAMLATHRVIHEGWTGKEAFYEWRKATGRCALSKGQFDKTFNNAMRGYAEETPDDKRFNFQILPVKEECMAQ
ncbi:MAG: tyrosine-protein phosphatase [Polyangiaceae bacterium]|nr:tyrosine-protein phosphatase [Polyangiaceae bacterium]